MVNNGYLNWSNAVPKMKHSTKRKCIRFSELLESKRKNIKCEFSILKDRLCILRHEVGSKSATKCNTT